MILLEINFQFPTSRATIPDAGNECARARAQLCASHTSIETR